MLDCLFGFVQVPSFLEHSVHALKSFLEIPRFKPQLCLEEVWNTGDALLFWLINRGSKDWQSWRGESVVGLLVNVCVGLDIQEGYSRCCNLITKLLWRVWIIRDLNDLLNKRIRVDINETDLLAIVPAHKARLFDVILRSVWWVLEESWRNLEMDFTCFAVTDDPSIVGRAPI